MVLQRRWLQVVTLLFNLIACFSGISIAQPAEHPTSNQSASWINRPNTIVNATYPNRASIVLSRRSNYEYSWFISGFFCNENGTVCYFGVVISKYEDYLNIPQIVWTANPENPVKINATLRFKQDGDLVLEDSDGMSVWSTNTGGKAVSGLNLTDKGNLVLFNRSNGIVWQSFDYPTDSLLLGQRLVPGRKLTARASISEFNYSRGLYSLAVHRDGLFASVDSNPPQYYYTTELYENPYVQLDNGSFNGFRFPPASGLQFMRLGSDGHLRVYQLGRGGVDEVSDLLPVYPDDCGYPLVCGRYGVCSSGQCGCPASAAGETSYFRQMDYRHPSLGCSLTMPISCSDSQYHTLLELKDTSYFLFYTTGTGSNLTTALEDCKKTCLSNCSCKAAVFQQNWDNNSRGYCLLVNEVFSLMNGDGTGKQLLYIKVQNSSFEQRSQSFVPIGRKSKRLPVILGSTLGALSGVFFICIYIIIIFRKRNKSDEVEEDFLDLLPGLPTRFSYDELKAMTDNFSRKLGEGGFGSVFEGSLSNDTRIAVKLLNGFGHVKNSSFLAEVQTIGSIHHVNLVKLIGFCAGKTYRLLVYEFMINGSLDTWIFGRDREQSLQWEIRKKIILDIAKGLSYLHEECRQKIIHLDIKPQNILLDENFNAKVSDFGLSKLIEKDQSKVYTTLKGTPGYMAPEWLSSVITEKVDVYSFGIVMLEIICGRKNLDWTQNEEEAHLLSVFKRKAEDEQLPEMVDKKSEDMQKNSHDIVEVMKIAAWCLQSDFTRRPSMSLVIKALEGSVAAESNLDYNFMAAPVPRTVEAAHERMEASLLLPSILSEPR